MILYLFKNNTSIFVRDGDASKIFTIPKKNGVVKIGKTDIMIADGVGVMPYPFPKGSFHVCSVLNGETYESGIVQFNESGHPTFSHRTQKLVADCAIFCEELEKRQRLLEDRILALENNFKYKGLDFLIKTETESEDKS